MLGGEPVVGHDHARVGGGGQRAGQVPVAEGGAHHVAAAVQQQDRRRRAPAGARAAATGPHRRSPAAPTPRRPSRTARAAARTASRSACRSGLAAVRSSSGSQAAASRRSRSPPTERVAKTASSTIGEQPPRAVEQRVAGQRQLDPMRGAAQQVAADEPFQAADLPAQRGLGHEQPGRGAPEVELLGDRHERPQVPQLDRVRGRWEHEHLATALRARHPWQPSSPGSPLGGDATGALPSCVIGLSLRRGCRREGRAMASPDRPPAGARRVADVALRDLAPRRPGARALARVLRGPDRHRPRGAVLPPMTTWSTSSSRASARWC